MNAQLQKKLKELQVISPVHKQALTRCIYIYLQGFMYKYIFVFVGPH